jgi:arylsulfatase A-like enzyme
MRVSPDLRVVTAAASLLLGSCTLSLLLGRNAEPDIAAGVTGPSKPNVIIILADDLGYADISAYGSKRIETPNIDRIGAEGVLLTDAYAAAPVCSPSRAALMTGRYPSRYGFEFNNGPPARDARENLGLDVGEITLAQALQGQGYRTGLVGKWHLGANADFYPTNRGYHEFVGFLAGATNYIDPRLPGVRHVQPKGSSLSPTLIRDRSPQLQVIEGAARTVVHNDDEYLTEYFARRGVGFIERNAKSDDPYFLYLSFNAPHDPLIVTQKYYDRFAHIAEEESRIYAAMISALDDAVGEILDAVARSGEADNTIVYFMSDNGCAAYLGQICACEPLRGGKLTHYEGGMRVPMMMRWPAQIRPGQVERRMVSLMDVFPTTLIAAGGQLLQDRVYDGVDLMPYLSGERAGNPHEALMWRRAPLVSIRQGDWKLWKSLTGEYTLLFNLRSDPNESTNLAEQEPARVKELEDAIADWSKDLQDPRWPSQPLKTYSVCGTPFTVPI